MSRGDKGEKTTDLHVLLEADDGRGEGLDECGGSRERHGYQRLDKAIVTEMEQMAWIRLHLLSSRNPGLRLSILPCLYQRTCVELGNATSTRDVATTRYSLFYFNFIQAPSVGPMYAPV